MRETILVLALIASPAWGAVKPFSLPWMNQSSGEATYHSVDHPGGVFVIEAYFLNCPYCNDNAPNVDRLADKYRGNPRVQVLDVGVDRNDSQYESWIQKHNPNHPVLKDPRRTVIGPLGTTGFPSTYVLDCNGNVRESTSGLWNATKKAQLEQAIEKLLGETCYPMPTL